MSSEGWLRDGQLLAPVLLSLPQQNEPSGLRVPSRRTGGPWRARHSHDRRDIRQPVETIDKAQRIRHECVGYGEGPRQPFASCQHRLQVPEPGLEELVQTLPSWRISGVTRERQYGPGQARHLD
jgi:hypothetical protein